VTRNLKTVARFAADSPFTESSIRWMIFQAEQNGLNEAKAIIRVGRRVYIDEDAFDRWLTSQQQGNAA